MKSAPAETTDIISKLFFPDYPAIPSSNKIKVV